MQTVVVVLIAVAAIVVAVGILTALASPILSKVLERREFARGVPRTRDGRARSAP